MAPYLPTECGFGSHICSFSRAIAGCPDNTAQFIGRFGPIVLCLGRFMTPEVHAAIHAVFRIESARLVASLARLVRDVGVAEELAQDALVTALEDWPQSGVPENPGAWLMATAKHHALNRLRRGKMLERKHEELGHAATTDAAHTRTEDELAARLDDSVGDDLLRLVFTACHPVLSTEARVALTLRLLGGLTTDEIARAFLVSESAIAQRVVRAKRTLAEKNVAFEIPRAEELGQRLASVLEVVYLIFNEGYSATAGDDLMRPALCEDALRLGRILAELAPEEPEVHGLVALMELNAARAGARVDDKGEPVFLLEQNRSRWDQILIRRGLLALERAQALGARPGPYLLQASIAACHARAQRASATNWPEIAELYAALGALVRSPVVELNRAVAVSMADGPEAGLRLVDALAEEPALRGYHLLPSARADLLAKLGRLEEARLEFERAATLTKNLRQRERLLERAADCATRVGASRA
ncbi:MAG TPA: RNA polymerase sigma factor [Polyangiaceae bacterium]|nr:RNA polymerase sigma factor [Polyangiaceae bacterium]